MSEANKRVDDINDRMRNLVAGEKTRKTREEAEKGKHQEDEAKAEGDRKAAGVQGKDFAKKT